VSDNLRMPRLLAFYQGYLEQADAASFSAKVSQYYTTGALERLTRHGHREVRRAAVLALGFVADYEANHCLGCALLDGDRTVRSLAENAIRCVWTRAGSDTDRREVHMLARLNAAQQYEKVVRRAGRLLDRSPALAEAWNLRAFAHHALGRFADAIRDCHEALEINPYHFIAAMGMGRAYLELGNPISALESFRRALRLNPDLEGVRAHVARLARIVEGK
jgi:tetratricopeptide (TPR) repeat protein